jgi:hypothetical protein
MRGDIWCLLVLLSVDVAGVAEVALAWVKRRVGDLGDFM